MDNAYDPSTTLLIATTNPGKLREMQTLLAGLPVQLVIPASLGIDLDVEENGETYYDNAVLKALAFNRASSLVTLADDSGLEVDALGGQPGIRSARFAPQAGATDAMRRAYLLQRLAPHARPWTAHFRCTVVVAAGGDVLFHADGDCPGEIIPEERGSNGFGYDPVFYLPELTCTMAELSMTQKNHLSHRARAVSAALPMLSDLFKSLSH